MKDCNKNSMNLFFMKLYFTFIELLPGLYLTVNILTISSINITNIWTSVGTRGLRTLYSQICIYIPRNQIWNYIVNVLIHTHITYVIR